MMGGMESPITIRPFAGVAHDPMARAQIDAIFFAASTTQTFESDAARQSFRERWLGRYLVREPQWAYVAVVPAGEIIGYLVASVDDPGSTARFSDIAYFQSFKDLTARFPAHLHVNLAPGFRSSGIGSDLIERFAQDAKAAAIPGVHVVTSVGARNVGFYLRNGFQPLNMLGEGAKKIVFLARAL